jgi:hypothetical protein
MNKDKQRLADYLAHMLQAIERITRYTELLDEVAFLQNELVQDEVIRNLEILGEASNNIQKHYPGFAVQHPELPVRLPDAQFHRPWLLQDRLRNRVENHSSRPSHLIHSGAEYTSVPLTRKIHANARRFADQFFHQRGGTVVPDQGNCLSGRKRKHLVLALRGSGWLKAVHQPRLDRVGRARHPCILDIVDVLVVKTPG